MSEDSRPGVATRVRAALRGEQRAETLEAMRQAGTAVYAELTEAEQARAILVVQGGDVWSAAPAIGGQQLATWNAFVLQCLGAQMLDADYAADAGTIGYVPPVTFEQAWSWLAAAAEWLNLARQARANPLFDLRAQFRLPADPPAFVEVEPCPQAHLDAMLATIPAVRHHAELALFDLDTSSQSAERQQRVNRLRQLAAEAAAAAEYAVSLRTASVDNRLHEYIEGHLKRAMVLWFHLGQLAAMPALIDGYRAGQSPGRLDAARLPGGPRFDPWCLTDPMSREQWQADPRARQAITALWAADPDPVATLTIQAQIDDALAARDIVPATDRGTGSYYFCCRWASIYQVRRPVRIGQRQLSPAQRFTFDVSGEELADGGAFVRRILAGPFHSTNDVDYCDPTEGDADHR